MSEQERFLKAQELINAGRYKEARKLLAKINQPIARQWEQYIDAVENKQSIQTPVFPPINVQPPSKSNNVLRWLWNRWSKGGKYTRGCMGLTALVFACIGCVMCMSIGQAVGVIPNTSATKTAEAQDQQATKQALATDQAATAIILALTPSATPTATLTPTETLTPTCTFTPSPTFTPSITPIPSDTSTATLTLTPSLTPVPSSTSTVTLTLTPSITPIPSATLKPTMVPQKRYATQTINLRVCAGVQCAIAGQLSYGEEFTAMDWGTDADGYTWYSFRRDGKIVWAAGWLTSDEKPSAPIVQQQPSQQSVSQPVQAQPIQPTQPASANPVHGAAQSCLDGSFDFSVCAQYQTPRNCDEAVQLGIPDRVAGCCFPKLDRNQNGFACYATG